MKRPKKRGPKPTHVKIEGMTWEEAMAHSLRVKRPQGGWPKRPTRPGKKRKGPAVP